MLMLSEWNNYRSFAKHFYLSDEKKFIPYFQSSLYWLKNCNPNRAYACNVALDCSRGRVCRAKRGARVTQGFPWFCC